MRRITALLALGLAACHLPSGKYRTYPSNPDGDVRKIVVLPFMNQTDDAKLDTGGFANIFSSELVKFPGFEVIRPQVAMAAVEEGKSIRTLEDAIAVGRRLKADAIIAVAVTDHSPYDPPRTALAVQVLWTSARSVSSLEIDRLVVSASWRVGPLPMSRERAGHLLDAFEEIWDAHNKTVREEVVAYSDSQEGEDTAYRDGHQFLAIQERWMQFVSNQAINRFIRRAGQRA